MAVIGITDKQVDVADRTRVLVWENLTASTSDTGKPIALGRWPDMSSQIYYLSGSGTTVVLQGSNDERANPSHADHANAVWATLKDSGENLISTTVNLLVQKVTSTWWIRPTTSGGTGVINVALHMTKAI